MFPEAVFLATGGKPYYLPIVPVSVLHDTPIAAVNYDAGETVGWPAFTDTVAAVAHAQPAGAVVVTSNYGEAGALLRFRPDVGPVHARQNSLWDQGPPSDTATAVIVVGFTPHDRDRWCTDCHEAARIDNTVNDEQDRPTPHRRGNTCTGHLAVPGSCRRISSRSQDLRKSRRARSIRGYVAARPDHAKNWPNSTLGEMALSVNEDS